MAGPIRVERSRLLETLLGSTPRVAVLSAPAGSGKSTLARQWVTVDARASTTVRLASYADDPVILAASLQDAFEVLGAGAARARVVDTAAEPAFSASVLPGLTRLAGACGAPYLLIVDDIHLLRSAGAVSVLRAVCEGVPQGSSVALLTRHQPPAWLARLRAEGDVLMLTPEELAFDPGESEQLLRSLGHDLGAEQVAEISAYTEGWAVGLYLTGLALGSRGAESPARAVPLARGSKQAVADYLHTEVIAPLPPDQRGFLQRTSVLEELSGPLCDAVLERDDCAHVLDELQRRLQLIVPIDDKGEWFRVHHLLKDVLSRDLATQEPAAIADLHYRAARWFQAHGAVDDAVRHAAQAGDVALVSELVWPNVIASVASGRIGRLHSWLGYLSDAQRAGDRWLSLASAWLALQEGDPTVAERWSRVAQRHAGPGWATCTKPDSYAASLAVLAALEGAEGLTGTVAMCRVALDGLAPDDGFRGPAGFLLGVALSLQGDVDAGLATLKEAEHAGRTLDVPVIEADAKSWLGLYALRAGDRDGAIRLVSEASSVMREHDLDRIASASHCFSAQSLILAIRGDKAAASVSLATARRLHGLLGEIAPWYSVTGRLVQAHTAMLLGDRAAARMLITEARQHMTPDLKASTVGASLDEAEAELSRIAIDGGDSRPLTFAELRVLQFLPSHLTFPQIGEHLFLSPATVKSHSLSIYRKLGVSSRDAAVERARSLGLVEGPMESVSPGS